MAVRWAVGSNVLTILRGSSTYRVVLPNGRRVGDSRPPGMSGVATAAGIGALVHRQQVGREPATDSPSGD
jgi:hypothetical protein